MNTISMILNAPNSLHSHIPNAESARAQIPKVMFKNLMIMKRVGDPGYILPIIVNLLI